jgi:arylsulfatase A-like enzyme
MKETQAITSQKKAAGTRFNLRLLTDFLLLGLYFGVIQGLVRSFSIIIPNQYFQEKMYRLIWLEFVQNINAFIVWGVGIAILGYLVFVLLSLIPVKRFLKIIIARLAETKKFPMLFLSLLLAGVFTYIVYMIAKYSFLVFSAFQYVLIIGLILLLAFLFRFRKLKPEFSAIKVNLAAFGISSGYRRIGIILLFLAVGINAVAIGQKLLNPHKGPHIILLLMDTLRADHLGCYGYHRPTSPHIDKFAKDNLLFERALSNSPWTKPSMGSLFTSEYPAFHLAFNWSDDLGDVNLTLAEMLKNLDYFTVAFQTNPILSKDHNFNQGFMLYEDMPHKKAELVVSKFNHWLEKYESDRPFFAYIHFMDPHLPYNAPPEFLAPFESRPLESQFTGEEHPSVIRKARGPGLSDEDKQHITNLYDAEIKYLDTHFEEIIKSLEKKGFMDNTVIILTSDHGEELWDHGGFEHGHTLYKEVLHVPLIMSCSKSTPPQSINSIVHLMDVFPTILHLAGKECTRYLRGKNLIPIALEGESTSEAIFFEGLLYGTEKKGILRNGWKLIEDTGEIWPRALHLPQSEKHSLSSVTSQKFELYNAETDFDDRNNVIDKFPQIAIELKKYLQQMKVMTAANSSDKKSEEQKKLEDLKSLGYIE